MYPKFFGCANKKSVLNQNKRHDQSGAKEFALHYNSSPSIPMPTRPSTLRATTVYTNLHPVSQRAKSTLQADVPLGPIPRVPFGMNRNIPWHDRGNRVAVARPSKDRPCSASQPRTNS